MGRQGQARQGMGGEGKGREGKVVLNLKGGVGGAWGVF